MKFSQIIEKMKQRWQVKSGLQVFLILIVFALTGSSVMLLRKWMVAEFEWAQHDWFTYSYYWLIFPIYNILLLMYGFIFGQFRFFLEFEKKFFKRIQNLFKKK